MSEDEQMYPEATRQIAEQRNRLAHGPAEAFQAFSKSVFAEGAIPAKDKAVDRGCGRPCDAVPVLHPRPYPCSDAAWDDGRGDHGSYLGRRGNARGGRLRSFGFGSRHDRAYPRRKRNIG